MDIKSSLESVVVAVVKNGCDQSCLSALKLAISQEGINDKLVFGMLIQSL